jgi:integrase
MKDLTSLVEQYLLIRRAQGSTVAEVGRILGKFCEYVNATQATGLTVQVAVGFASARDGLSDRSVALRLSAVRGFCRWAQTLDPRIEVPPGGLLKARRTRNVPYIYGAGEIAELLAAAAGLHPAFRGETLATLIGLMAATGIRTGEARALDLSHFNPAASTLRIPGKYGKIRLLPLHPSVTKALSRYAEHRAGLARAAGCPALLVSSFGNRLSENYVSSGFRLILERTSLTQRSRSCRPRLMDLRHTFAVNTMLQAYESGQDPMQVLPVLSTWMGHALLADTYWYLSCTPALMQAAAQRLESEQS